MAVSTKADKAKHREQKRRQEWVATVRRVFTAIGIWDAFQALPYKSRQSLLDFFRTKRMHPASISVTGREDAALIQDYIQSSLDDLEIQLPEPFGTVSCHDFCALVVALIGRHEPASPVTGEDALNAFLSAMHKAQVALSDGCLNSCCGNEIIYAIDTGLIRFSNVDSGNFIGEIAIMGRRPGRRGGLEATIQWSAAKAAHVNLPGKREKAYPLTASILQPDGNLASIGQTIFSDLLGVEGPRRRLPIYLTTHAIRRFRERVNTKPGHMDGRVDDTIYWAFKKPIVKPGNDCYLVEFSPHDVKLGYFTVVAYDGKAVATSFLFLTMDGTPEGQQLNQILRLRRDDKLYLGLSELKTYVYGDIHQDKELTKVLEACGCGHLLELTTDSVDTLVAKAEEVRAYLGNRLMRAVREL